MFALLRQHPTINDAAQAPTLALKDGCIEVQDLNFQYHSDRPILNNISFTVAAKQKVAIVGSSGAGKSTLLKLLFRFYDASSGRILIDGQDIKTVSQASLRGALGIVPQDTVLFNMSILENIRYGRIDASDEDIYEAIRMAHLSDFIARLPKGVDTLVGERGLKLSGGEKQRVAIARALLKKSPIMIFDEATSSLDSASERLILEAIKDIAREHTMLVIAHRLSTVVDADHILVLDQGEIVEQGNHASLLAQQGQYAHLWLMQQRERSIAPTAEE